MPIGGAVVAAGKADEMAEEKVVVRGLEGVCAAETRISFVDGINGNLYYAGYNIHELA